MAVFTKGQYNCACSRTVCDWSCTTYATMMSGLVPNTVVGYVPPLKKTNADRIRTMTDEELAKYYFDAFFYTTPYCFKPECTDDDACEECLLRWLKQEVSDEL